MQFLFEKKYPLFSPVQSDLIQQKFSYLLNDEGSYQKVLHEVRSNFNLGNAIDFFECHDGYVDVCCFCAHANEKNIFNVYLNNLKKLENFKDYFLEKFNITLNQLSKKAIILPDEMRLNFTSQLVHPSKLSYFENGTIIIFSKRESEIIQLLRVGKTSKKIAQQLNLSPRTIESYLETIKTKASCYSKSDLVEKILKSF